MIQYNLTERSMWRNEETSPLSLKRNLFSKSSAVRLPKQKCVGVIISTKINSHSGSELLENAPKSTDQSNAEKRNLEQLVMAVALDIQKKLLTGLD